MSPTAAHDWRAVIRRAPSPVRRARYSQARGKAIASSTSCTTQAAKSHAGPRIRWEVTVETSFSSPLPPRPLRPVRAPPEYSDDGIYFSHEHRLHECVRARDLVEAGLGIRGPARRRASAGRARVHDRLPNGPPVALHRGA